MNVSPSKTIAGVPSGTIIVNTAISGVIVEVGVGVTVSVGVLVAVGVGVGHDAISPATLPLNNLNVLFSKG